MISLTVSLKENSYFVICNFELRCCGDVGVLLLILK